MRICVWKRSKRIGGDGNEVLGLHIMRLVESVQLHRGRVFPDTFGQQYLMWCATYSVVHLIILSLKESCETAQEMIDHSGSYERFLNKEKCRKKLCLQVDQRPLRHSSAWKLRESACLESVYFKNLYPSDFEDLNLLLPQGHLDHLLGSDKRMLSAAVKLWTRNLVIRQRVEDFQLSIESYQKQLNLTKPRWDAKGYEFKHDYTIIESPRFCNGTLTRILEALDYRVKEFKIKRLNPGMNTCFWTEKDMTRNKEFIAAIERRLKTRRIYQNLECFVGGRVRDIDYRLLQRTK
ncbi:hypothetical protein Tco_0285745 [Tanacetum coccineum]